MENKEISTNEKEKLGVYLSQTDAEEYRAYKKRKKLTEISYAFSRSEGTLMGAEDTQKTCERATRLKQAAVKLPLSKLSQAAFYLAGSRVKLDCVVGGAGETLTKVKAYETKIALRRHAKEITLVLTPSLTDACRYGEIRREVKRLRRIAKKAELKVYVGRKLSLTVLGRLARIASEAGARYFSIPYFLGCERLRMDLTGGCQLEVCDVETLADFRKLMDAGVGRIVTEKSWELYSEWLKEASETFAVKPISKENKSSALEQKETAEKKEEQCKKEIVSPAPSLPPQGLECEKEAAPLSAAPLNPETNYRCRLEGSQLKFL